MYSCACMRTCVRANLKAFLFDCAGFFVSACMNTAASWCMTVCVCSCVRECVRVRASVR